MNNEVTIRLSSSSLSTLYAKLLVLVFIGCIWGYFFAQQKIRHQEKFKDLSPAERTEQFEEYEARIIKKPVSAAGSMIALTVFLAILFGLYELLGRVIGMGFDRVLAPRSSL